MEDTYNTNFKKSDSLDLKIFFQSNVIDNDLIKTFHQYQVDAKSTNCIEISSQNKHYQITIDKNKFELSKENLIKYLNIKLNSSKKISKLINLSSQNTTRYYSNEFTKIFKPTENLHNYLRAILSETKLSSFNSIHLFTHKKGETNATHEFFSTSSTDVENISSEDFFDLYNSLKKSKDRSFGQATFKASKYNILGTCIGREAALTHQEYLFFISRDDMLPIESAEKEMFDRSFNFILNHIHIFKTIELNINSQSLFYNFFSQILKLSKENICKDTITQALSNLEHTNFNDAEINHKERISLLGELLNTVRHELSNPLFGLQLTTEVLKFEELNSEQRLFINQIEKSIHRSQKIIENFSEFFSPDIEQKDCDIIELIREVFTLTKSESREIKKNIYFNNTEILKDFIFNITTHPTSLAQILFNLVINSVQAIKEDNTKNPTISVYISEHDKYINLKVVDNGPGISKEHQNDLFEPFFTTKKSGTGLGLDICHNLAKKINAELSHKPTKVGSIFVLRISK